MTFRKPNALPGYLEGRADWTFGYGRTPKEQDCVRFVNGGVLAVTGVDVLRSVRSRWTTAIGARRVLKRRGGLASAVAEAMAEIDPPSAQRGDVGVTEAGALVLFEGETVVGLDPERGQVRLPRAHAVRAFTV